MFHYLCIVKVFHRMLIASNTILSGGFFLFAVVASPYNYGGVYPRANIVMVLASIRWNFDSGKGTPFFCAQMSKSIVMFNNSKAVFSSRQLAKQTRRQFIAYFSENFPPVRSLKCKIDPHNRQVIASAKFGCRRLYARARTIEKCFSHFIAEYHQKVMIIC